MQIYMYTPTGILKADPYFKLHNLNLWSESQLLQEHKLCHLQVTLMRRARSKA
jgi:hypothetical protein